MEPDVAPAARHRATGPGVPPATPGASPLLSIGLWAGRGLLPVAAVAVAWTALTTDQWTRQGFDGDGSPIAWLPNAALVLTMAVGVGWPWLLGLAAPPDACWRDGERLVARTVLGRRRVDLRGARVVPFRMFGRAESVHGTLVLGRRSLVVLLGPVAEGRRTRIDHLLGLTERDRFRQVLVEWLLGILFGAAHLGGFAIVFLAGSLPVFDPAVA
ncbi:hypothetical protein [Curtobacterium sp. ISL-83]|uniref:hypothetical protein n=1 Tax=Curtobacterium sp. ISL-83 TaxID=2819145 RepID=UPI001BE8EB78|nr:hypothetical protein [Curtobacterium sp. ISL-83]MBT2503173.1 hypothetical protein [Curtobacterium sp. ISL-83]